MKPLSEPAGHATPPDIRRRAVRLDAASLVRTSLPLPGRGLPLLVEPNVRGLDLSAWAADHGGQLEDLLLKHGGLLFRGFNVRTPEEFERFIRTAAGEPLAYHERSSPRSAVSGRIYTSTDYPADQSIFLHNENSYQNSWPLRIFFLCVMAARTGGETPVADVRNVYRRIAPEVRQRFVEKQAMIVRNFGDGMGLPWESVFQTKDRAVVEEHCRQNGIRAEWLPNGNLRTRTVRPVVARHPQTGEWLWFNHLTFFHVTTREPRIRDAMLAVFKEEELPTNTYYGDGTPIEPQVLDHLRDAYLQEQIALPWQEGDILMLDNMLAAHGRGPYTGPRKVLVGMARPTGERNL